MHFHVVVMVYFNNVVVVVHFDVVYVNVVMWFRLRLDDVGYVFMCEDVNNCENRNHRCYNCQQQRSPEQECRFTLRWRFEIHQVGKVDRRNDKEDDYQYYSNENCNRKWISSVFLVCRHLE